METSPPCIARAGARRAACLTSAGATGTRADVAPHAVSRVGDDHDAGEVTQEEHGFRQRALDQHAPQPLT